MEKKKKKKESLGSYFYPRLVLLNHCIPQVLWSVHSAFFFSPLFLCCFSTAILVLLTHDFTGLAINGTGTGVRHSVLKLGIGLASGVCERFSVAVGRGI